MKIRIIDGRAATDRDGASEHLHRSTQTIKLLASRRTETGFPMPVDVETEGRGVRIRDGQAHGREWYALDDLDQFKNTYIAQVEQASGARVQHIDLEGDPGDLLGVADFATYARVKPATVQGWVRDSKGNWNAARPAYLPKPDDEQPGRGGIIRKWKRSTIAYFLNNRAGVASSGRTPGRAATVDDLIAAAEAASEAATVDDIAAALAQRLGRDSVHVQTVFRLRRMLKSATDGT
ncbi:MAG TPA: hypothetical protein VF062_02540 [Candidatus Limnocylindrales bacterium]